MSSRLGSTRMVFAALAAAFVLALAAPPAITAPAGAPALTDSLRLDPQVRTGVLPNGIRFYILANQKPEQRVSLRLALPVGSTAEADDQQGLAHFTEHMNFNGSAHFADADALVSYLRSIGLRFGADANAYTSFDETVYMLDVPTDRDSLLDRGLMALSDFAGRATLSDKEFEKERGVVLEEWRLGQGAQERIQRQQFPVLFHGSRYAERLPIGRPEIIQTAPAQRLRDFYRYWYRPEWMAVIAVGDVDPGKMETMIRARFSDLVARNDTTRIPRFDMPRHQETLVSVVTDKEATSSSVGVTCKRMRNPEVTVADYRSDLRQDLFSAMLNARFDEIQHRANAPFLSAGAFAYSFTRSSNLFSTQASVADGGIVRGLESLLEETARVRAHGFLPSELERAKRDVIARAERQYAEREKTDSRGLARDLVQSYLNREPSVGIEADANLTKALVPGVTLAEVNALADTLLSTANRVVLASAPEKAGAKVPAEADLRAVLDREAKAKPEAWVDKSAGQVLMAKAPKPGTVKSRRVIDELGVTVLTFANGVEAWLKPTDFKADEILFTAYAPGGLSLADSATFTDAQLSSNIVNDGGVGGFTSTDLQKLLAGKIVGANPYAGWYTHGVNGSTRPQDLETALQLIYLGFTQPTENAESFATLQKRFASFLADRRNSPEQVFGDSATAVNTGGFYMARPLTVPAVDGVKLATALDFFRKRYANAADFTFFFAGNFAPDSIAPLLARYLGTLPSAGKRTSAWVAKGPRFPEGVTKVVVKKGVEPKASVRITYFTHQPIEELDQHRANSAASILNDHLRQTLRELMGGTYGASARFGNQLPVPGYSTMTISFGCAPSRVDTMIAATLTEVKKLVDQGPSAEDVTKEQEVQRRELETNMMQNTFWTGSMQTVHMLGWDPKRILKRRERIDLLTPVNLKASFQEYFPAGQYSVVTLVPEVATSEGKTAP